MREPILLHCYSSGDRRYSALYAQLACGITIERAYQSSKRDKDGNQYAHPKGVNPYYILYNNNLNIPTAESRHLYYTMLWYIYLKEQPGLWEELMCYDGTYERPGEVFWMNRDDTFGLHHADYFEQLTRSCNQALSIAWLKYSVNPMNLFPSELVRCIETYWNRYHS